MMFVHFFQRCTFEVGFLPVYVFCCEEEGMKCYKFLLGNNYLDPSERGFTQSQLIEKTV